MKFEFLGILWGCKTLSVNRKGYKQKDTPDAELQVRPKQSARSVKLRKRNIMPHIRKREYESDVKLPPPLESEKHPARRWVV